MTNYHTDIIEKLESSISVDRLFKYIRETDENKERALKLYVWNSYISSAFYQPLQSLEVTIRNKLHNQLASKYSRDNWYEIAPLQNYEKMNIQKSCATVKRLHVNVEPPHVVAELSFGFWLSLLNKKYHQNLWIPSLNQAFPNANLSRAEILKQLDHLLIFRNRIAHHEPIFQRHLAQDYKSIIQAIKWICPDTARWTDENNSVVEMITEYNSK